ncbi:MAG: copper chaperone PCu(A)C [Thiotrichaceae bacterium]|nr:copper chaperone PCu(A)C [Thiotrichaceae bacterium]
MNIKLLVLIALTSLVLSSCDRVAPTPSSHAISVDGAYIRAMPSGQKITALFMTLHNNSEEPRQLVGASSIVSKTVELHEHTTVNGMMKMGQVAVIDLPKNSATELKPGGYHLMLIGLKEDLKVGQEVTVSLSFADGTMQDIEAPVSDQYLKK